MAKENEQGQDQEQQFACEVDVRDSGAWQKKISVTIPREQVDEEMDRQLGEFRWSAEVPGFRKGRAPRRLIEKRYGDELNNQVKLRLLGQAFEKIESEHEFDILTEPDLDPEAMELPAEGDFTFEYEVEIKPEFELPQLEGMQIEKSAFEVTDERVNDALEHMRERLGQMVEVTDGAQAGDLVTVDVKAKVEGVEEEATEEGATVRVGQAGVMGVLVEDMDKVLKGAKAGDAKKAKAKAGDSHEKEKWQGKEVEFELTVKAIRRLQPAELNEEFFSRFGVSDESELRERIEEDLEQRADREIRNMMAQQVLQKLDEQVQFELPAGVAGRHADRMLQRRFFELLQQGVGQEQIQENLEQLRASSSEESRRQLKMSFVMEKVAQQLDVEISEGEVNAVVAQFAMQYGRRPERLREELTAQGRLDQIRDQIRDEKAVDKILEMAEVVDKPGEAAEEKKPAEKKPAAEKTAKKSSKKSTKKADKKEDAE